MPTNKSAGRPNPEDFMPTEQEVIQAAESAAVSAMSSICEALTTLGLSAGAKEHVLKEIRAELWEASLVCSQAALTVSTRLEVATRSATLRPRPEIAN